MRGDFVSQAIDRLAAGPGLAPFLTGAAIVTVLGLLLTVGKRTRKAGVVITWVGLAFLWFGLLGTQLAQLKVQINQHISVVQPRYGKGPRLAALYGMVLIPALVTITLLSLWRLSAKRRKAALPVHLKSGLKALFQQDYVQALKEFNIAVSIDKNRAESYNRRGQVYLQMGNLDAALADFEMAL